MFSGEHRTRSNNQQVFNLQHPHPVVFDFSSVSSSGLEITIPIGSAWTSDTHWHYTPEACEDVWIVSGHYFFSHWSINSRGSGVICGGRPGHAIPLRVKQSLYWRRYDGRPDCALEPVICCYRFSNHAQYDFYRQLCGVNQDAERYFHLPSTPLWLRLAYALWGLVPYYGKRIQAWLVSWCLWIQWRVIYAKNDYWTYEGYIPYTLRWQLEPFAKPPQKWADKQRESIEVVSGFVRNGCYWIGTRLLGMRESYAEYGPSEWGNYEMENLDKKKV